MLLKDKYKKIYENNLKKACNDQAYRHCVKLAAFLHYHPHILPHTNAKRVTVAMSCTAYGYTKLSTLGMPLDVVIVKDRREDNSKHNFENESGSRSFVLNYSFSRIAPILFIKFLSWISFANTYYYL